MILALFASIIGFWYVYIGIKEIKTKKSTTLVFLVPAKKTNTITGTPAVIFGYLRLTIGLLFGIGGGATVIQELFTK